MIATSSLRFDDSEAYDRFMGAWSAAVAPRFVDWIAVPQGLSWLDVGCGTGILTSVLLATKRPTALHAVDPAASQVARAVRRARSARFSIARAEALPFRDGSFDVVASALVLNFLDDRDTAMHEMRRVVRDGGVVAGFVWNFAVGRSPSGPMRQALRIVGVEVPDLPGTNASRCEELHTLFEAAGLDAIQTRQFDVSVTYATFDDYWLAQTPAYSPTTRIIAAMNEPARSDLQQALRSILAVRDGQPFACPAQANAIKAFAR